MISHTETMKAIQIKKNGPAEVLELMNIPIPDLGEGEVLVRNDFSGINFHDIYVRNGLYPSSVFPLTLGCEGAGEIVAAHSSVVEYSPGTKVAYTAGPGVGSYSQYTRLPASSVVRVPDRLSTQQAAAVLLQGLSAWSFIRAAADVKEGQWTLVHAAAGGVGGLLIQMLRRVGAKIIATAGSEEKCAIALGRGARWAINSSEDDVPAKVKDITAGHGVDVIFDGVGKATFDDDLDMIAMHGQLISFGNAVRHPSAGRCHNALWDEMLTETCAN
jgi:NADPH2:quinone reductase